MVLPPELRDCQTQLPAPTVVERDDGEQSCLGCGIVLEPLDSSDNRIAYCPECGECLAAPKPWCRQAITASGPESTTRGILYGCCEIAIALALSSALLVPGLEASLRLAGALLGSALFIEGVATLHTAGHCRQPRRRTHSLDLPEEVLAKVAELGSLKAVFQTTNSRTAIVALSLGIAGELALLHWLKDGAHKQKLLAAALLGPSLVVYLLCRVMRLPLRRRYVLIFAAGLVCISRRRVDVYPWNQLDQVFYDVDSVDDYVLEIRFKFGLPPLRFGGFHFRNLKQLWLRLQEEVPQRAAEH
jgi:predicted RNA-binding Zn-ribbon protein involved in translation (DUF1610 family)